MRCLALLLVLWATNDDGRPFTAPTSSVEWPEPTALPTAIIETVQQADQIHAFRVQRLLAVNYQRQGQIEKLRKGTIVGFPISSGPITLDEQQRRRLRELLDDPNALDPRGLQCITGPDLVLRAVAGADTLILVMEFWCSRWQFRSGGKWVFRNFDRARTDFVDFGLSLFPGDSLFVGATKTSKSAMPPTGTITGRVLGQDGHPLGYSNVVAVGTRMGAMAREGGLFTISWVPAGHYSIKASFPGCYPTIVPSIEVRPGETTAVSLHLEDMPPTNTITIDTAARTEAIQGFRTRADRIELINRVLGLHYPYEVVPNSMVEDGGWVDSGFIWDSTATVHFAFDGGMMLGPAPIRHLYLGATNKWDRRALKLPIDSEAEAAVREVFRLFCEDNLPADSVMAVLRDDAVPDAERKAALESLPEQQMDAVRIHSILLTLDGQARSK